MTTTTASSSPILTHSSSIKPSLDHIFLNFIVKIRINWFDTLRGSHQIAYREWCGNKKRFIADSFTNQRSDPAGTTLAGIEFYRDRDDWI